MLKFLAVVALLVVAVSATPTVRHHYQLNAIRILGERPSRGGRIVGGSDADIERFPYQIAMFYNRRFTCGGSILNEGTIISAAHCTYSRDHSNFQILAGYTDNTQGEMTQISSLVEHPQYNDVNLENDIVIMKVANRLVFGDRIRAVPLPSPNFFVQANVSADLAGWGTMEWGTNQFPTILQAVEVPTMTNARCQEIYSGEDEEEIFESNLCAGEEGRDACQGDSGGPLVYNGVHVGIVSWGYGCAFQWPTVYTRVSEFLNFIIANA